MHTNKRRQQTPATPVYVRSNTTCAPKGNRIIGTFMLFVYDGDMAQGCTENLIADILRRSVTYFLYSI